MFDNIGVFNYIEDKVKNEINKSKLVRNKNGWFLE
jgi:hypothetical protein